MNLKPFFMPLVLLLAGSAIIIIGALFKIMHWPYASEILIFGMAFEVIALVLLILKLTKVYHTKT